MVRVYSLRLRVVLVGVVGLLAAIAMAAYLLFAPAARDPEVEAHYAALEKHRREQSAASQPSVRDTTRNGGKARNTMLTDFRGPRRDGRYDIPEMRKTWPQAGLPALWRQPVGGGYASFVAAGGAVFTIEQRRGQEMVAAYDLASGRELWTHAWSAEFREPTGGDGPRSTPTWHEERLYVQGARGDLRCLAANTGALAWSRNILDDAGASNLQWGMAASPLVADETVVVQPGGPQGRSVVAYDKRTGEFRWAALDDPQAYVSPMLVTLAGRRQILTLTARRAVGLAVEDGALLWEFPWNTDHGINCSQPLVVGPNRIFLSSGYGQGAALVEIAASDQGLTARPIWANHAMENKFNSSVFHEGHVYGLDEGILACVDVETGERLWKAGRYGYGQLLLAGGYLLVTSDQGDLALVRATPERHTQLSRFSALSGRTWNVPAIVDGRLLVRNSTEMACFDLRP